MEFEQLIFRDTLSLQKLLYDDERNQSFRSKSSLSSNNNDENDHDQTRSLSRRIESFQMLDNGTPKTDSADKKLSWLRSQVIGNTVEFDTPFGKRRLTYADHTASGRCLQFIEDYVMDKVLPFYGNSHTSDSFVGYQTTKIVHEAANYVKKCLGGGEEDAIIFCGSGSTAAIKRIQEVMGIAIPSIMREKALKYINNDERWVIFVGPYEHHSNILSWRQSLAEVVEIGLDDNGLIDMEALRLQLHLYKSKHRPMLGSFSACSNVTGIYSDTRAIAQLLHQYGAFACFDFAASGPYVKIDMKSGQIDGYDAVYLSPHKFLGGPGSPGILLMNKILYQLGSSPPSTCGGGTVDFVNGFNEKDTLYVENIEEREDAGTPPIIQKIRTALAFWVKEYIGHDTIERWEHFYIEKALKRLLPNPNIEVLGNTTEKRQAVLSFLVYTTSYSTAAENISPEGNIDGDDDMRGLYLWRETGNKRDKPLHGPFVAKLLNDLFGIQARGGCACAGPYGHSLLKVDEAQSLAFRSAIEMGYSGVKPGWTRVSFPYYMSKEEFEFTMAALEFLAIYGQRFLPLYHFNWKTGAWTFKKRAMEALKGMKNNCYYCGTSLPNDTTQCKNSECNKINNAKETTNNSVINKYAKYLATAKFTATLLPKFPPHRRIPEDIDLKLVTFRI